MLPIEEHVKRAKRIAMTLDSIELYDGDGNFNADIVTYALDAATHYFEAILPVVAPVINSRRRIAPIKEHYENDPDGRLTAIKCVPEFEDIDDAYTILNGWVKSVKYKQRVPTMDEVKRRLANVDAACKKAVRSAQPHK